jgi:hypothetical protein
VHAKAGTTTLVLLKDRTFSKEEIQMAKNT